MSLEVGKCYRWKTNKYELGKFLGKKDVTFPEHDEDGHPTGKTYQDVVYKFTKMTIGDHRLDFLEEYDCPANMQGGRRRKTRSRRVKKTRKNRKNRK